MCVTKSKGKKEWYNGLKSKSGTVVRGAREELRHIKAERKYDRKQQ